MTQPQIPTSHVTSRLIGLLLLVALIAGAILWFTVTKIVTGEVEAWYYQFAWEQDQLFDTVFYFGVFPWDD